MRSIILSNLKAPTPLANEIVDFMTRLDFDEGGLEHFQLSFFSGMAEEIDKSVLDRLTDKDIKIL